MIIYHGTLDRYANDIIKNGVLLSKSKNKLDFGKGFYTSENYCFALHTAKNKVRANNSFSSNKKANPAVLYFEYTPNICKDLKIKKFKTTNLRWTKFIIDSRMEKPHNFDIVTGYVADGKIELIVKEIVKNNLKFTKHICNDIIPKRLTDTQISFHSQKGLSCIKYIKCDILSLEKVCE